MEKNFTDFMDVVKEMNRDNVWFKPNHLSMYKDFVFRAARESHAIRRKAGALILSGKGSLFIGYNGTPANEDNCCEDEHFVTKPNVIHAEDNAIRKMVDENIDPTNSILFITDSPCMNCVNNVIVKHNIKAVFYFRYYTDRSPLEILDEHNIKHYYVDDNLIEDVRKYLLPH